jgi:hypothetical protein
MKKFAFIALYILFHLFILREIRTGIFDLQMRGAQLDRVEAIPDLSIMNLHTRLIYFEYESIDYYKVWHYKMQFGLFFLIAMIALIALGAEWRYYLILAGSHFAVMLISSVILIFGIHQNVMLLSISDLLSRYFIPFCSIGIASFAYLDTHRNTPFK